MALGDIAAKLNCPVFPCDSKKRPLDAGGFHTATLDQKAILAAFNRPNAQMIGVPTGLPSNLIAIDVDVKPGRESGMVWLDLNKEALPETRTHKTRSGGLHLLFIRPEGVTIRNSAGKVAPGVDVRGDGGYIIVPPSPGYAVADDTPPAEMPQWLITACCTVENPQQRGEPHNYVGGSSSYGLAALKNECDQIRQAKHGEKHYTLNRAAYSIGGLVTAGALIESDAMADLVDALHDMHSRNPCDDFKAAQKTLRAAFNDGKSAPRAVPEKKHQPKPNGAARPEPQQAETPEAQNDQAEQGQTLSGDEKPPLDVVYFDDIHPKLDTADFVEGLLIEAAMSVIYGQSNSGKTFFMSDLALHVAAAKEWNGREIAQGAVIWLAMEGAYGISNRVAAWREANGIDASSLPFAVIPTALNLLDPAADTSKLIRTIKIVAAKLSLPVKLVVADTLSRAIAGGNENSPEDMGALVTNGTRIQQETGAHVAWIHHSGKDEAKGARGHSLLRAASDTEIEISAEGQSRIARVTKQREMECAGEFAFSLKVIELGTNGRGKPVTSCVVVHSGQVEASSATQTRLRGHTLRAFEVLMEVLSTHGRLGDRGVPSGIAAVPERWWRERFYERALPGAEIKTKEKTFRRAADTLIECHRVAVDAGRVWIVAKTAFHTEPRTGDSLGDNYGDN